MPIKCNHSLTGGGLSGSPWPTLTPGARKNLVMTSKSRINPSLILQNAHLHFTTVLLIGYAILFYGWSITTFKHLV